MAKRCCDSAMARGVGWWIGDSKRHGDKEVIVRVPSGPHCGLVKGGKAGMGAVREMHGVH